MSRRHRSPIFQLATAMYAECSAAFELHRENEYARAETACNGRLLNRRGQRAGVNAYELFHGNRAHAYAYASEELVEHWERYPRPVFAVFEAQWLETQQRPEPY